MGRSTTSEKQYLACVMGEKKVVAEKYDGSKELSETSLISVAIEKLFKSNFLKKEWNYRDQWGK